MKLNKEHLIFGALVLIFLLVLSYETIYYTSTPNGDMMSHHDEMHGFMAGQMGPSFLGFNLLFWILIIILVYFVIKSPSGNEDGALKILDERYARGEIGRDEYIGKFRDLKDK